MVGVAERSVESMGVFEEQQTYVDAFQYLAPLHQAAQFIPELAQAQAEARHLASAILANNRERLMDGDFDGVPIPVDPLSTADVLRDARDRFGVASPECQQARKALLLDCHRLLLEAFRANTWEYFPESQQVYNSQTGDFYSHGHRIADLVTNGLSPVAEKEEQDRRLNEAVEEMGTYRRLGSMLLGKTITTEIVPENKTVTTISECTDWAIQNHKDGRLETGGYVPKIQKFMIRSVRFDVATQSRYEEQLGASGEYIDHDIIVEALRTFDQRLSPDMSKTDVHATQMVTELDSSAWDWIELLDSLATQKHGVQIFMGELLHPGQTKDYDLARRQAAERSANMDDMAGELAQQVLTLADSNVDHWAANGMIENELKTMMFKVCREEPSRSYEMFDAATAQGFAQVQYLESIGQFEQANLLRAQTEKQAPAPEFCGAGSCGLEHANLSLKQAKDLNVEIGDKVLKDTQRACKCGNKSIVYAYNKTQVKKLCTSCGAKENKQATKGTY